MFVRIRLIHDVGDGDAGRIFTGRLIRGGVVSSERIMRGRRRVTSSDSRSDRSYPSVAAEPGGRSADSSMLEVRRGKGSRLYPNNP